MWDLDSVYDSSILNILDLMHKSEILMTDIDFNKVYLYLDDEQKKLYDLYANKGYSLFIFYYHLFEQYYKKLDVYKREIALNLSPDFTTCQEVYDKIGLYRLSYDKKYIFYGNSDLLVYFYRELVLNINLNNSPDVEIHIDSLGSLSGKDLDNLVISNLYTSFICPTVKIVYDGVTKKEIFNYLGLTSLHSIAKCYIDGIED